MAGKGRRGARRGLGLVTVFGPVTSDWGSPASLFAGLQPPRLRPTIVKPIARVVLRQSRRRSSSVRISMIFLGVFCAQMSNVRSASREESLRPQTAWLKAGRAAPESAW